MVFTCLWRCDLFFASAGKEFCRACHSSAGKRRWSIVTSPAVTGSCSCTCGWGFILSHFDDFWLETILSGWKGHSQTDLPLGVWYHWYLLLVTEDKMTSFLSNDLWQTCVRLVSMLFSRFIRLMDRVSLEVSLCWSLMGAFQKIVALLPFVPRKRRFSCSSALEMVWYGRVSSIYRSHNHGLLPVPLGMAWRGKSGRCPPNSWHQRTYTLQYLKSITISFRGIPNSRNVLFLQIFLKRAAKPNAANPVEPVEPDLALHWRFPKPSLRPSLQPSPSGTFSGTFSGTLNLTWLSTKASQTFSGSFSGSLLNLTWFCTKASRNLLRNLLRNPVQLDLAAPKPSRTFSGSFSGSLLNLTWLCTKASQTFSGTLFRTLLNLTWRCTKASQTFSGTFSGTMLNLTQSLPDLIRNLRNLLRNLVEPDPAPVHTRAILGRRPH